MKIKYRLCLECGRYFPHGHPGEKAWMEEHKGWGGDCTSRTAPCFVVCDNPALQGLRGWKKTPVLSVLEVFAWAAAEGLE